MRVLLSWSGGKDSAWALQLLRAQGHEVAALLSSFDELADKVPIHDVPLAGLQAQAASLGLPLIEVPLPPQSSNAEYERRMLGSLDAILQGHLAGLEPIAALAFGDIYLTDIRGYREQIFAGRGVELFFPLWRDKPARADMLALAVEMLAGGIEAQITALDEASFGGLDPAIFQLGASWDHAFINALPESIDPCGERGEFHTFVTNAPGFAQPVRINLGLDTLGTTMDTASR